MSVFQFKEPKDKAVFTCNHVLEEKKPILFAAHENDGDWQFLCGEDNHTLAQAKIVSLKEITELDPTVNDLSEMPIGVEAERSAIGKKWTPFKISTEQ